MSITQEQVKNIAKKLAKLKLLKNEEKTVVANMNSILDYIDLLGEVDTTGVIPTVSVITDNNPRRTDKEKREIAPCSTSQNIQNKSNCQPNCTV
ncbi:MAG: Asp-tRNA(Asn)/Glu-tRNA(Gln) amidotransferase subunit GatC [Sphingobium sp.]|nr:Asp-tRNA(Asn)/Glu-tRNA(Gln) amidotransferase subunit GatC [Sphingobium sp.]